MGENLGAPFWGMITPTVSYCSIFNRLKVGFHRGRLGVLTHSHMAVTATATVLQLY